MLKLNELRKILREFGCWEDKSRGKGSHTMFFRKVNGSVFSLPIPKRNDVLICYIKKATQFKLAEADGVPDSEFYGKL